MFVVCWRISAGYSKFEEHVVWLYLRVYALFMLTSNRYPRAMQAWMYVNCVDRGGGTASIATYKFELAIW